MTVPPYSDELEYLGAEGVGRRTLKNRIVASDPSRFATAIPRKSSK